jgi:hypothetical protein
MSHTINTAVELLEKGEIDLAIKVLKDPNKIHITWGLDDITDYAKQKKIRLSKTDAINILYNMAHHHDAEIGINWEVIDACCRYVKAEKKIKKMLKKKRVCDDK